MKQSMKIRQQIANWPNDAISDEKRSSKTRPFRNIYVL